MKFSKKAAIFIIAILSIVPVLVYAGYVNTLEHNSEYNVRDYVYETLDKYTTEHKYFHDELLDPGYPGNDSDPIEGILDGDKVIDLYYGYNNTISIRYYDAYTGIELTDSDYVSDKEIGFDLQQEHLTKYDISALIDNIYSGYSFIEKVEYSKAGFAETGSLTDDFTVSVYLGRAHNIVVNWIDEFTGEKIGDKTYSENNVRVGDDYDIKSKKIDNIEFGGKHYTLDFINVNDAEDSEYTFDGKMPDKDIKIDLYYTYNNTLTVKYVDKYTGKAADDFTLVYELKHNSKYDVTEKTIDTYVLPNVTREDGGKYDFIDTVDGDVSGILDEDKEITVIIGYYHKITVRYRDKYTGEVIHEEVVSVGEAGSEYNLKSSNISDINYKQMSYWYDGKEGDELSGVLDSDKNATLFYGYDNTLLVSYKDMETKKEVHIPAMMSLEHLSAYGAEKMTDVDVEGYEKLDYLTGDNVNGTLDSDKAITVWYSKLGRQITSTGDNLAKKIIPAAGVILLAMIVIASVIIAEKIRKKKEP